MKDFIKGFCTYDNKRFYLDLSQWANGTGDPVIDVVEDGKRGKATKDDVDLMDLLMYGQKESV